MWSLFVCFSSSVAKERIIDVSTVIHDGQFCRHLQSFKTKNVVCIKRERGVFQYKV